MKLELNFLSQKSLPTWEVVQGKNKWFFNRTNGCIFDHPYNRALKLYNKLQKVI